MKVDSRVAIVAVLIVAGGVWFATIPAPSAKPERPVLRFIAKIAKLGLWVMLAHGSPVHNEGPVYSGTVATDEQGNRVLDHGRGW